MFNEKIRTLLYETFGEWMMSVAKLVYAEYANESIEKDLMIKDRH